MKQRGHLEHGSDGRVAIVPCPERGQKPGPGFVGRRVAQGAALAPGEPLFHVWPAGDGAHVYYEEVWKGGKPAKVATAAFRSGWDTAFGGGMVN